jgi:hypothetical protein
MSNSATADVSAPTLEDWVAFHWPRCRYWLLPALDRMGGTHDEADIVAALLAQQMQLWPGKRCAVVTEIVSYPRLKSLNVVLGGGDLTELVSLRPALRQFGHAVGCSRLEIAGRPGWQKAFPTLKRRAVLLTEEI